MTEEQYRKLNRYLNDCFLELEQSDSIFIDYLYIISGMSEMICDSFNERIENKVKHNNLIFEEIFLLAREVIEKINKDYLRDYDNFIKNGVLDFGYCNEYSVSHYSYGKQDSINIRREYSYNDVGALVHEFMHYTNIQGEKVTSNAHFLTEFISIYFQEFTKRYLIEEKGINEEEIDTNFRIIDFLRCNDKFNAYCLVLLAYDILGNITSNTPDEMKNILRINDNVFEKECLAILEKLENDEKNSLSYEYLPEKMAENFNCHYRYIIGTLLAFYALENCEFEDIVELNLKINTDEYANMSIEKVLNTIGFKIHSDYVSEAIECVKKNIQNSKVKK